jgi:putative methionine-R-sulfoxide reductase with GAF domain
MFDDAAVVIVDRRRMCNGERAKRMFSQQAPGFRMQRLRIEGARHGPLVTTAERGPGVVIRSHKITISALDCAPPGMEIRSHTVRLGHPDVGGEQGVHRPLQPVGGPLFRNPDSHPLTMRMDSGIGAAGAHGGNGRVAETGQYGLHLPLYGAGVGLALPAGEAPSVILSYQEDRSRVHVPGKLGKRPVRFNSAPPRRFSKTSRRATLNHCAAAPNDVFSTSPSFTMPPRTLASLAHALSAAPDLDQALIALGESLAELDRGAALALIQYDARRDMLRDRLTPVGAQVVRSSMETTFDHLPEPVRQRILAGGPFIDVTDRSADYARLCGFSTMLDGGVLSVRGMKMDGMLGAVLALYEPRKIFGTRTTERLAPAMALFDLAYVRLAEREAREEAVRTLEDVTQRVHGEYVRKLGALEAELREVRNTPREVPALNPAEMIAVQAEAARAVEEARRAARKAELADQQLTTAVSQLEQAHIELHRRSEALRQRTRTLYLVDRALTLDAETTDARTLVDALLALVGDDMQAQRCSLMLRSPEPDYLYLAAARGIAPNVVEGMRIRIGEGVAGRVAAAREPMLVQDVREAAQHPLLRDQYFTTGSFISFPLLYHGELVGVLNLTNRAQRGIYTDEDVERVRLLGLVISLIASRNGLPEKLLETLDVH